MMEFVQEEEQLRQGAAIIVPEQRFPRESTDANGREPQ